MTTPKSLSTMLSLAFALFVWATLPLFAETAKPSANDKTDTYPLTKCPVSGQKLGSMGDPVIKKYDGREVRFCCGACPAKFEKDLQGNLKKLDAEVVKAQLPTYPLDTCVVSGDKLGGEMGKPIDYVYKGQLVRLCCKACIKDLEKNPQKYLSKINAARKAKGDVKKTSAQSTETGAEHHAATGGYEDAKELAGHEAHGSGGQTSGADAERNGATGGHEDAKELSGHAGHGSGGQTSTSCGGGCSH